MNIEFKHKVEVTVLYNGEVLNIKTVNWTKDAVIGKNEMGLVALKYLIDDLEYRKKHGLQEWADKWEESGHGS